jgi:phosphoribosylamine---glycine ligase
VALCVATLQGRLPEYVADWDTRASLGVVMAAGGYPGAYRRNDEISGLFDADDDSCKVFHAGTAIDDDRIVTSGGRVLCVVGLGGNVGEARDRAYAGVDRIRWSDAYFRKDIGHRAINRNSTRNTN